MLFIYIQLTSDGILIAGNPHEYASGGFIETVIVRDKERDEETRSINRAEKPGKGLHGTLATRCKVAGETHLLSYTLYTTIHRDRVGGKNNKYDASVLYIILFAYAAVVITHYTLNQVCSRLDVSK